MVKGFLPKHTAAKKRGNAGEKELRSLVRRNIVCVGTGRRGLFTASLKRRAAEPRWPCISITGFGEIVKENGGKSGRPRAIGCEERLGRRCAKRPRPAAMGRRSAKKGRPGEHEGTKRRGETKGESHCTRREKVRPAGGPGSGGVAKRPRLGGEKRREKGWAIRGGGVRKKGGWGRCYVGGRRKREHYKAKDGNCNFLSLSLLL